VFDGTNLTKRWHAACVAAKLGSLNEGRYTGLLVHDLRRSAIKNLLQAGVSEKVAMTISGHKTRAVFDRYNIADEMDVLTAMRQVQVTAPKSLAHFGESSVRVATKRAPRKRLTA
jgi:integrase